MAPHADPRPEPQWSELEAEILAATVRQLQEHGYDRLTLDAVAIEAHSSKSTIHRRWSTKAQLVVAAFIEGTRASETPPRTGTLRGDLIRIGTAMQELACQHASTMRAVLNELTHNPELSSAFYQGFVQKRMALYDDAVAAAIERGEIAASDVDPEFNDLLGGYLVFRAMISEQPADERTVRVMVDEYLLPRLTRDRP
jgi:AcrR family transcriptional regulator